MKNLNITKDKFTESKYFTTKYGKLEYVSESGNLYKTSKGHVLKFNESSKRIVDESSNNVTTDNSNEWFGGIKGAVYVDAEELGRDWEDWGVIKYKGKTIEVSDLEDELGMEYDDTFDGDGDLYHTYFLDWVETDLDKTRLKKLLIKLAR